MALKPTIYKLQVDLADSDRNCYESLSLTIARHPSETAERMTARLLAYCLLYTQRLEFSRGLSSTDEPDLWLHSDSGETLHWIEVGQPEEARLRKACGRAREVSVYAFGSGATTWWKINGQMIQALPRLQAWQLPWEDIGAASEFVDRGARLAISITGGTLYLDNGNGAATVEPILLCDTR